MTDQHLSAKHKITSIMPMKKLLKILMMEIELNVMGAEEGLTRKLWLNMQKFAKKFSNLKEKLLIQKLKEL